MPSFLKDYGPTWIHQICVNVLKQGHMPKHIGFIMDGNRRNSKDKNLGSAIDGYRKGDDKLSEVCKMLVDLGIPEATVYLFSLENFKRSSAEVGGLMTLFEECMHRHLSQLSYLNKKGYGVEVIGDYTKATTPTLRNLFAKVTWSTRNNNNFKLNVAFADTGQDEISRGLECCRVGINLGSLLVDQVDGKLLGEMMAGYSNSSPDIIIRTGGDRRLSDFLTWSGSNAYLVFLENIKWPELTFWHLFKTILQYQIQVTYHGLGKQCDGTGDEIGQSNYYGEYQKHPFPTKARQTVWEMIKEDAGKI